MTEKDKMFFRTLGLKIIPAYFYSQNPEKTMLWQYNFCRQTCLIIDFFLKMKGYKSEMWMGNFNSLEFGKYDHAWNYIPDKQIIVDVASVYGIIEWSTKNDPSLFKSDDKLINCKKLDLDYFDGSEYYTGKNNTELIRDILEILAKSKFKL